jgi:SAM-dependent methyltransferase
MVNFFGRLSAFTSIHLLACSVSNRLSREKAVQVLNRDILPATEYGKRIQAGRDAQGIVAGQVVASDDPVLAKTYGEFPLESFDLLIDAAIKHLPQTSGKSVQFVDVGSGCGRLCLYTALTRGDTDSRSPKPWKVKGIEIYDILHEEATRARDAGFEKGWLQEQQGDDDDSGVANSLSLHLGPAEYFSDNILKHADLIFAYCTTWTNSGFSPDISAMILSDEWNRLFSDSCKRGCIVVTTDRALDPKYGWKVLERLDVANPEVMESTGFVQIKK